MAKGDHTKGFLNNIAASAAWETFKSWGWPFLTSLLAALWQRVRHGSVDWWGIAALFVVTCIVFWIGRSKAAKLSQSIPAALPTPDEATNGNEALIEDMQLRLKTVEAQISIFNPLQIEAFQLAKDVSDLKKTIPLPPFVDPNAFDRTAAGISAHSKEIDRLTDPWEDKLRHAYANTFADRVTSMVHRFGAKGCNVADVEEHSKWVVSIDSLDHIAKSLRLLAVEVAEHEN